MTYNNSKQAGELRRHRAHYAVIVMNIDLFWYNRLVEVQSGIVPVINVL